MPKMLLILVIVLGFLGIGEKGFGQYQWVDKKGTVHFSEDPPPQATAKEEKKPPKENIEKILKRLEFGNREIPDDMKKYGPAGGGGAARSSGGGSSSRASRSAPVGRS